MTTLFFPNESIIILRTRLKSADKWAMSATFTAMDATIEPTSPERLALINGRPGHTFTGYVSTDYLIREGDRIITLNDDGGRNENYEVKGVSYWQGTGILDHQEVTLTKETA